MSLELEPPPHCLVPPRGRYQAREARQVAMWAAYRVLGAPDLFHDPGWSTEMNARELAAATGLEYRRVLRALHELEACGRVARSPLQAGGSRWRRVAEW